ncbi:MAG: hypothetical protein HS104_38200 [Polyangiaceae bacterium]|nr:hypothetical protein [Polyangiaceae bacterium]MCL4749833.1 hypothetical protein [Myxococcales bacterium]
MRQLEPKNRALLARLRPFVVAITEHQSAFDCAAFGLEIQERDRMDPLRVASAPFLELLRRLDAATFGPEGMPMPRWVFFDGAELPGGIVGFGADVAELQPNTRELLRVEAGYHGLVPLSMFIAIPTHERGVWMAHNLASMAPQVPSEGLDGLGGLTKAYGLGVYRAARQIGATQWNSSALSIHTRLGPLELLSAWTPAHSEPWTLTYGVDVAEARLLNLARDPAGAVETPPPDLWVDSEDHALQRELQARIEAGERFQIVGKPEVAGHERLRVPVAKLRADA